MTTQEESVTADRDAMYRQEHLNFLDAVAGKRAPESPAADAIVSVEIIEAAIQSWQTSTRARLAEPAVLPPPKLARQRVAAKYTTSSIINR